MVTLQKISGRKIYKLGNIIFLYLPGIYFRLTISVINFYILSDLVHFHLNISYLHTHGPK